MQKANYRDIAFALRVADCKGVREERQGGRMTRSHTCLLYCSRRKWVGGVGIKHTHTQLCAFKESVVETVRIVSNQIWSTNVQLTKNIIGREKLT